MNGSPESEIESYNRAAESLLGLIRGERYASRSASSRRQRAETRLSRVRAMLEALDDPQRNYPVVHVTGTSGKGSTAAAVAAILTAAGYRAGLRTSPYLQVPTEKLQVGPSLIDAGSFAEAVTLVLDTAARLFPPGQACTADQLCRSLERPWLLVVCPAERRYRRGGGGSRRAIRRHQCHRPHRQRHHQRRHGSPRHARANASPTSPGTRPGSSNRAPLQLLATFPRGPFDHRRRGEVRLGGPRSGPRT